MPELSELLGPTALEAIYRLLAGGRISVVRYPQHGCSVGGFDADANRLFAETRLAHPENPVGDPPAIFDLDESFSHQRLTQSLKAPPAQKLLHDWSSITSSGASLIELCHFCTDHGLRSLFISLFHGALVGESHIWRHRCTL